MIIYYVAPDFVYCYRILCSTLNIILCIRKKHNDRKYRTFLTLNPLFNKPIQFNAIKKPILH